MKAALDVRVGVLALCLAGCAAWSPPQPPPANLGAFAPTPIEVAVRMLELAEVGPTDVVYDLGSGDGRIVILAAQRYQARGVGVEIDPTLIWFSRRDAERARVGHLVSFREQDALTVNIAGATVVTLYLTKEANLALRPRLRAQLRPGARVVSHAHDMGDWPPDRVERVALKGGAEHTLFLWRIAK